MIEKGYFFLEISDTEVMDLASLTADEWRKIDALSKQIMSAGQAKHSKVAFLAAFLNYYMGLKEAKKSFGTMN